MRSEPGRCRAPHPPIGGAPIWKPVRPTRPVEILDGERWLPGLLEGWLNDERGWYGYVHYNDGSGRQALVHAELLRPPGVSSF